MKKRLLESILCVLIVLFSVNFIISANLGPAPTQIVTDNSAEKIIQEAIDSLANNLKNIKTIEDKSKFWKSFTESEIQNEAWNKLTSEEKKVFLQEILKKFDIDINNRLKGLDSELTWEGSKLKIKNGAYLDFENLPSWITEIDYNEDKLTLKLDTQFSGNKENERTIIFEGKGTINEEGILELEGVSNKNLGSFGIKSVPKINLVYGEAGKITIRENNEISILGGADLKINNDFYKQFYSENSKWYKPENGGDEEAIVKITQTGESPKNFRYFPEAKNTIVSISNKNEEVLGEFYTSRRQGVKIINSKQFYFDPFKKDFDYAYDNPFYESKEPFIEVNLKSNNKVDIKMVGDYYMGFVAEEGTKINDMYLYGKGGLVKGQKQGQYLHVKNGDFKTSIKKGETFISGNSKRAIASIERMRNGLDSNPNNELKIVMNERGSKISTIDERVNIDINIKTNSEWEPSPRLTEVKKTMDKIREAIVINNP